MFKKDYIPAWLLLFYSLGIVSGFYYTFNIVLIISMILLLFFIYGAYLFFFHKPLIPSVTPAILSFLIFFLFGITAVYIHTATNHSNHYTRFLKDQNVFILRIVQTQKATQYAQNYLAAVEQCNAKAVSGKILLHFRPDSTTHSMLKPGMRIIAAGVSRKIDDPKNPYGFNYRNYLAKKQIYRRITLKPEQIQLSETKPGIRENPGSRIRKSIIQKLDQYPFKTFEKALIKALLLGDRSEIPSDMLNDYRNAGAVHILAISGLHIGILLILLNFLFKPLTHLPKGKTLKLLLELLFLWGFAFVAGMSASTVRAVTLFSAVAVGTSHRKGLKTGDMVLLSAFLILIVHPYFLFDVGFQLSYAAVISIISFQGVFSKIWKPWSKILYYFWQLFTVSLAAQLGVLPLSLYYFHQFPGLFFVSSLLLIPMLGLVLSAGFLMLFWMFWAKVPAIFITGYTFLIDTMNGIVKWIGSFEGFILRDLPFSLPAVWIFSGILIALWYIVVQKKVLAIYLFLAGIIALQLHATVQKIKGLKTREWIVFDQTGTSWAGLRNGKTLRVFTTDSTPKLPGFIRDYQIKQGVSVEREKMSGSRFYSFNGKTIFHLNRSAFYLKDIKPDILLLSGNPKVHLTRVLNDLNPRQVIADHSNYTSNIKRWEQTCKELDIPFYSTAEKGAYRIMPGH